MTKINQTLKAFIVFALLGLNLNVFAQIDNWRAWDKKGVNVFEPVKDINITFDGVKVRVGGSFNQQFQSLTHENDTTGGNQLYDIAPGFGLATANLNIDVQMADGIRMCVENYMSSHHHREFWVKGGYVQIDKLPFFGNPSWFDDKMRVKVGHMQVNYGDQQFRRVDNANGMYNPFVGNYIMDAFATEIGAEVYYFATPEIMLMGGMTNGLINPGVAAYNDGKAAKPAIYLKGAYDKQINDDTRVRLSASLSTNSNSGRSTLYGGDRTGSAFVAVMAPAGADLTSAAFQGRWNPGFSNQYTAIQINPLTDGLFSSIVSDSKLGIEQTYRTAGMPFNTFQNSIKIDDLNWSRIQVTIYTDATKSQVLMYQNIYMALLENEVCTITASTTSAAENLLLTNAINNSKFR